jgi:putative membrane protein
MIPVLLPLLLLLPLASASAHAPPGLSIPGHWHATWSTDPLVLVPFLAVDLLYAIGLLRLWRRAGPGRGVPVWRALLFALGLAALFVALITPLDAAADASFAMHMAQHMLLVVVAAPLIALGRGGIVLLTAMPAPLRRPVAGIRHLRRIFASVPAATLLHGVTIWLWHVPGPYEAALASNPIHYAEHLTMFGTGVLFWWSILNAGRAPPLGYGAGVAALFLTMLHTGFLGILITLAPAPLYASYATAVPFWSLSPLEDQQLAGIVMLLPGGLAYLVGGLALLAAWLNAASSRQPAGRARA